MSPMKKIVALLGLASIIAAVGCFPDRATGVDDATYSDDLRAGRVSRSVTVMTRNRYVGANVDRVLAASSPGEIPALVEESWQELLATSFPDRADAIAKEIDIDLISSDFKKFH